jgi:hypothetical protein
MSEVGSGQGSRKKSRGYPEEGHDCSGKHERGDGKKMD